MEQKTCSRCNQIKSLDMFDKNPNGKWGRSARCKTCRKEVDVLNSKKIGSALELTEDETTRVGAEEVLCALGYEIYNPNNPVHKQFEERLRKKGVYF